MRRVPRMAAGGVSVACALSIVAASGTPAPAVSATPDKLASFTVAMVPGDQLLAVTWRYATTGAPATALNLDLYWGEGTPARVASTVVGRTLEPDTYTFPVSVGTWMLVATPRNAAGGGFGTASAVVRVTSTCATATICTLISSSSDAPVRLVGQGFLHGAESAAQPATRAKVAALTPKQWRLSWRDADAAARTFGVSRTEVISDLWNSWTAPGNGGYARTPWSNWAAWDAFVTNAVLAAARDGWTPDYWDVWNEPNGLCCPRFGPADVATITVDRWLEMYVRAWRAIKSADPDAKVVGPSLSALQWEPGAPHEFDLDTFLTYSAAQGVRWDAVAWHENNSAPSPGDMWALLANVDRHIALAKAVMRRHPNTVLNDTLFVNEYGAKDSHMLPGWAVGYFRAFEVGGVSQTNRACWSGAECTTTLDGLLTTAGDSTALWWAHRLYADLGTGASMRVASSASWQVDGLAARDNTTRTVRALLGRHWLCNQPVNPWCGAQPAIAPASVTVTIDWPYGRRPVRVTASRLPAGIGAVAAPEPVTSVVLKPKAKKLTLIIPAVNDGDALSIVARRA